jgi:hypothetical protein
LTVREDVVVLSGPLSPLHELHPSNRIEICREWETIATEGISGIRRSLRIVVLLVLFNVVYVLGMPRTISEVGIETEMAPITSTEVNQSSMRLGQHCRRRAHTCPDVDKGFVYFGYLVCQRHQGGGISHQNWIIRCIWPWQLHWHLFHLSYMDFDELAENRGLVIIIELPDICVYYT